ncbi:MBOAT family protein, partial [Verrucomicrobiota bacterium]
MYFNSIDFFVFFAIVYLLYLALDHRRQNKMLLAASYFFYGCWDWRFLSLLLFSTVIDYFCGIKIHESDNTFARKRYLWLSVICNLGMLGFFKYFGFFSDSFVSLMNIMGLQVNPWSLKIILPIGISFYTFQTMSYTIDIYRRKLEPTRNFWDFALFVAFFPQLVAGPIERAKRLLPQISAPRHLNV